MSEKKLLIIVLPLALFCGCFIAMAVEQMTAAGGSSVDGRYAFAARETENQDGRLGYPSELQKAAARRTDELSARLIEQAETFAEHIRRQEPAAPERPRLKLLGISYCEGKPSETVALIQAGESTRWLRQSHRIDNLTIESIQEKAVVVSDGRKTFVMRLGQ